MIDFILERYNYWIFIILMMMGLYIVISRGNLVKKIIGLNVFQTSVFIFYISIGKIVGGTAPILLGDAGHGGGHHGGGHGDGHHGDEHGDNQHGDGHHGDDHGSHHEAGHDEAGHQETNHSETEYGAGHEGDGALHAADEKHLNQIGDAKIDAESLAALKDGAEKTGGALLEGAGKDLHAAPKDLGADFGADLSAKFDGAANKIGNDLSAFKKDLAPSADDAGDHANELGHDGGADAAPDGFYQAAPADGEGAPDHMGDQGADLAHDQSHDLAHDLHHGAAVDPSIAEAVYTNPLPHVLILTAIVVGVATTAVGLALAVRIREAYGTIEEDELIAQDLAAEFGPAVKAEGA